MLKILMLAPQPFFQNRGTPIAVRLIAEELAAIGYLVDLVTLHEGEDVVLRSVRHFRIPRFGWLTGVGPGLSVKKVICDLLMMMTAFSMLRKKNYDVIHAVEEAAFIARFLGLFFKVPFVYDMDSSMSLQIVDKFPHMRLMRPIMEHFERNMMRASIGIVAVCTSLEEQALTMAPRVPVLRLEDISLLSDQMGEVEEDIRQTAGLSGTVFLYVGNLERYQGLDLLIDAFSLLPEEYRQRSAVIVIGGSERDIEQYRQQAAQQGGDSRIRFLGPRPMAQLGGYLEQADILVSPRLQGNNTPMKIYSYLDSGKPVLATALPTHTQVLDETIAMLAEPNPEAFMQAMVALLDNEQLGEKLAHAAREKVRVSYSLAAYRQKLSQFYRELESRLLRSS